MDQRTYPDPSAAAAGAAEIETTTRATTAATLAASRIIRRIAAITLRSSEGTPAPRARAHPFSFHNVRVAAGLLSRSGAVKDAPRWTLFRAQNSNRSTGDSPPSLLEGHGGGGSCRRLDGIDLGRPRTGCRQEHSGHRVGPEGTRLFMVLGDGGRSRLAYYDLGDPAVTVVHVDPPRDYVTIVAA